METTFEKAVEAFGAPELFGFTGELGDGDRMAAWILPSDKPGASWLVYLGESGPLFVFTPFPDTSWEAVEAAARALV